MGQQLSYGICTIVLLLLLIALPAFGQSSDLAEATKGLQAWRESRACTLLEDFGELARYRDANAHLKPPATGEKRVVFYGDSITDIWPLGQYFPGAPNVNRGIGGQTTSQMLIRFRQDAINLRPAVVVILAGTNDIAGNTGPMSLEEIEGNFESMAELAGAQNIRVVLSSVLPVHNYTAQSKGFFPLRPMEKIRELNRWLRDYCSAHGCVYLDYYSAMIDEHGLLKKELADDGLHPNAEGYALMTPLATAAIKKTLHWSHEISEECRHSISPARYAQAKSQRSTWGGVNNAAVFYCASTTQRNPIVPARSRPGPINKYF